VAYLFESSNVMALSCSVVVAVDVAVDVTALAARVGSALKSNAFVVNISVVVSGEGEVMTSRFRNVLLSTNDLGVAATSRTRSRWNIAALLLIASFMSFDYLSYNSV